MKGPCPGLWLLLLVACSGPLSGPGGNSPEPAPAPFNPYTLENGAPRSLAAPPYAHPDDLSSTPAGAYSYAQAPGFPEEIIHRREACRELRLSYPFFGRPNLDEDLAQRMRGLALTLGERPGWDCAGPSPRPLRISSSYRVHTSPGAISLLLTLQAQAEGRTATESILTLTWRLGDGAALGWSGLFARPEGLQDFLAAYAGASLQRDIPATKEHTALFAVTPTGLLLFFPACPRQPCAGTAQESAVPLEELLRFRPRPGIWF